jgi:hypothetical protein
MTYKSRRCRSKIDHICFMYVAMKNYLVMTGKIGRKVVESEP